MAIGALVGGTASNSVGGSTTPGLPAGVVDGDLLVLIDRVVDATRALGAAVPGAPAGWTQKTTYVSTGSADSRITLYYRRWASGVTAPTITYAGGASAAHVSRIYRVPGAVTSGDPTDFLGSGATWAASASAGPIPGGVASADGGAVLVMAVREDASSATPTTANLLTGDSLSWVELTDDDFNDGDDSWSVTDYALVPTARTITSKTFTLATSPGNFAGTGIMWALLPQPTAVIATAPLGETVTEGLAVSAPRALALAAGESGVEPVAPSVALVHAAPFGEVVVDGLPVVAAMRNTDLPTTEMAVDPLPLSVALAASSPSGEVVVDPLPVAACRAAEVAVGEVLAEPVAPRSVRVVHLPVGEVSVEARPVAVVRVVATSPADVMVDGFDVSSSFVVAVGDLIVEGLPVTVAYGAEVSASRRGLPPVIFLPSTRVIAQNILTGEFLHWDLPVKDLEITWTLSGPTVISGMFEPEIRELDGLPLTAHGTWLHVEDSGLIRASGILQPTRADDQKLSVEALGPSSYAAAIPYRGVFSQIGVDPAAVVKHLWQHIQSYPRGDLGVQVHGVTPVKLGTEPSEQVDFVTGGGEQVSFDRGGPYKLEWFTNRLIGAEIDELAGETPFDYTERAQWNADKTDVEHHIEIAYPRTGRRRTDLRFADGENILESAPIEEPDGVYADEVIVQGSGEGQSAITGRAALPTPSRLRMPVVVVDKSVTSKQRADARAAEELAARLAAMIEVSEIAVQAKHANAPLGSFSVGDEIQTHLVLPHVGAVSPWSRITGIRYLAETEAAVLALTRRGEFASR